MLSFLIVAAKTLLSFAMLWTMTRLLGKRQISQLTYFDYITGITIGSMAANLITPEDDWRALAAGLVVWGALTFTLHWVSLKSIKAHQLLDGVPTVLVQHGELLDQNLAKNQLNVQEVMAMLRAKGYFNVEEVEFALLETNGHLSVLPRSQYRPLQPRDLAVSTSYEGLPTLVMQEGKPVTHGLKELGLTETWLAEALARQGTLGPVNVFAAWQNTEGQLVVSHYQERQIH